MAFEKKGQTGIEFTMIVGVILFFMILFLSSIWDNIYQKEREKEMDEMKRIVLEIKEEIDIASETTNGYKRKFDLPTKIRGRDYKINNTKEWVYLETEKEGISISIRSINGTIKKGDNIIEREDDKIYINK